MRPFYIGAIAVLVTGCTNYGLVQQDIIQANDHQHDIAELKQFYGCRENDYLHYQPGKNYSKSAVVYAKKAYPFAMMSSNVNNNGEGRFVIPNWEFVEGADNQFTGFEAEVYKRKSDGVIAIAFKGTGGISDVIFGDTLGFHYAQADWYTSYIDRENPSATSFILTGHSLGAGNALYVGKFEPTDKDNINEIYTFSHPTWWMRYVWPPELLAWFYNPKKLLNGQTHERKVFALTEDNDVLDVFRKDTQEVDFNKKGKLDEHAIYPLAIGLTYVAAANDDKAAEEALKGIGCIEADQKT
ncbi:hypothetical protein [Vibrio sp. RE88]|uniref:hypothetical protein n=1 Tax=Vibrio sp. RE88 TaxID=2607610 RepID=UPI0014936D9C|nr:hypothetical protein [Vibrio sp. RE88]NOH61156.1 hypothetical protein [Vibrio sp. RE88]